MKKRIFAFLLTFCMVLAAVPVSAGAATGPRIYATEATVTAGNSAYVYLYGEDLNSIGTLGVEIYYDATALTLASANTGSLLSGAMSSVNTDEAGRIKLVAMSLDGISGSGYLLMIRFRTAAGCTPGKYPITVALGTVADSQLEPIALDVGNGSVTVTKPVLSETFGIYGYCNKYTLQKGDLLSYQLTANSSRSFASADFIFTYDHELFAFEDLVLESPLQTEGALWSVNDSVPGQVRVAYASTNTVATYSLMYLKLRVIENVDTTSAIQAEAANVYREDLAPYISGSVSTAVTLTKLPEVEDHPDIWLDTEAMQVGKETGATLYLEGSQVAAADFALTYDPAVLSCTAVEAVGSDKGHMLVINDNFTAGTIRFSYINETPSQDTLPLVKITWKPLSSPKAHHTVKISGVGVVDIYQKPVTLEYKESTGCIYVKTVTEPTCAADGTVTYTCGCGNSLPTETIPMEHPWDEGVYTAPTYEADGFTTFTCTNCGKNKVETDEGTQLQPAAILTQPQAVNADSGDNATFTVVASNTAVSYRWEYRKIWKWFNTTMEGYDTHTLTVPATGARNSYDYRCVITFADGTVLTSEPGELTVNTQILNVQNPNDQTAVLGYKGQFTAAAEGEGIKYQWQYKRPNGERWINTTMDGATKPTVYIETTTARDGYQYRCQITDVTGKTVYTEPATLRVLSFKSHPAAAVAAVGNTAYFTVEASADTGFTYQWQYSKDGVKWSNTTMTGYNTQKLSVAATLARNGYQYRCIVIGAKNSKLTSKAATLTVIEPVKITTQPESVTVTASDTAVFRVEAAHVSAWQWQYSKNGTTWYDTAATGCKTATLTVPAKGKNGYQYRCQLTGLDGTVYTTAAATLTLQ